MPYDVTTVVALSKSHLQFKKGGTVLLPKYRAGIQD